MLKIMTLNMWGYYEWEKRKDNLLALVNKQTPDIIALQEVQLNHAFSDFPESDFIANNCDYKYRVFAPTYPRNNQIDTTGKRTQRTSYGLAIISKHPIIKSETHFLQLYPDHLEECSVVFATIDTPNGGTELCNVHFANTTKHSDLHLRELIDICLKRSQQPIILGDFNCYDLEKYKDTVLKDYALSIDVTPYISMPSDNWALDHIIIPSRAFSFKSVVCPDDYVSDHRSLIATINRK